MHKKGELISGRGVSFFVQLCVWTAYRVVIAVTDENPEGTNAPSCPCIPQCTFLPAWPILIVFTSSQIPEPPALFVQTHYIWWKTELMPTYSHFIWLNLLILLFVGKKTTTFVCSGRMWLHLCARRWHWPFMTTSVINYHFEQFDKSPLWKMPLFFYVAVKVSECCLSVCTGRSGPSRWR